jgi:hypothetical protein
MYTGEVGAIARDSFSGEAYYRVFASKLERAAEAEKFVENTRRCPYVIVSQSKDMGAIVRRSFQPRSVPRESRI